MGAGKARPLVVLVRILLEHLRYEGQVPSVQPPMARHAVPFLPPVLAARKLVRERQPDSARMIYAWSAPARSVPPGSARR
jgi:hypothetical protein